MTDKVEASPEAPAVETALTEGVASEATEITEGTGDMPDAAPDSDEPGDESSKAGKSRSARDKEYKKRLKAEAEDARREAGEARRRLDSIKAAYQSEVSPREEDFTDPFDYSAAKAVWAAGQKAAERETKSIEGEASRQDERAAAIESERMRQLIVELEGQKAGARDRYSDFDAVFDSAYIPQSVAEIILEGESAAEVGYYLGKNPTKAREIASLSPVMAAREIGFIEARLSAPSAKLKSSAPDPIKPVKGAARQQKSVSDMTPDEFAAWRAGGGAPKIG